MEVTAAERTTIYTNISPLAQRVNNYIQTQHSSIAAVAKDIGYSRTTVSRYLTGKYDSNPNDLESKLTDFLTRQTGEAVDLTTPLAKSEGKTWQTPVFFESRDAKAVLGVCQSCQEYIGLGIVVARSGYGKTYALRQYAKLSRVAYIECDDTMSSRDLVEAIERSIGLPNGYGTIWRRVNGIREFFNTNKGYLLIIDEADKLVSKYTQKKMEILRAVFDQSDVGLVIAGEPKLEAQIKTYLVRMANRVDFYASLRGLSPSEVEGYLTDFQIEPEALVELKARACNMQTGCFRLLDRTLSKEATVETKELYYPQISAQAGSYTFEEGVELEIYSSKSSYYDWAKIRFTSQFRPKLSLKKKDPATIQLGYDGTLEDVFTGFVSGNYDGGTYANEVALKDEMLLMEETIINDTFLDTTPQELISYFLAQAGLSKMKLSSKTYPTRKMLPIRKQTAVQAINAVNAAWGLRVPFFFSGGVFYWDEKPEQKKVYTFERGVNILNLRRAGGVWELETVSAPFIKHSHKINLIHPQVSGEVEVSKVVSKTNDSGFIRTYIYF